MEIVGPGMYIAPGRYGQVMDRMMERARKEVEEKGKKSGDQEERRQENLQQDQTDGQSSLRGGKETYESQVA